MCGAIREPLLMSFILKKKIRRLENAQCHGTEGWPCAIGLARKSRFFTTKASAALTAAPTCGATCNCFVAKQIFGVARASSLHARVDRVAAST
jgi:hypothetical protein